MKHYIRRLSFAFGLTAIQIGFLAGAHGAEQLERAGQTELASAEKTAECIPRSDEASARRAREIIELKESPPATPVGNMVPARTLITDLGYKTILQMIDSSLTMLAKNIPFLEYRQGQGKEAKFQSLR